MPTYVYRCKKCKHRFEVFHAMSDEMVRRCPRCKGKAERVPAGGAGLLFKGTGFYITDYRSKAYKDKAKSEKSAGTTPSPASGTSGGSEKSSSKGGGSKEGASGGGGGAPGGG